MSINFAPASSADATERVSVRQMIADANGGKVERVARKLTPVGEMTQREAERVVDSMVSLYREYKGGTRAEALRLTIDTIIECGQKAPSEAHRLDYRLQYIVALDQLRAER